jgi:hypothetical protein
MYDAVHDLCRDYAAAESPELILETAPADIRYERERSTGAHSDAYLETLAVYRKLAPALSQHDVLLFHASAVAVDGAGYLFTAVSGTGKSTHIALWRKYFGEGVTVINGDKPILRKTDEGFIAYGTPWCGKEGISQNRRVALTDILMIERGKENKCIPLSPKEALRPFMDQVYVPDCSVTARLQVLDLVNGLLSSVGVYKMECTPTSEAALVAYQALFG